MKEFKYCFAFGLKDLGILEGQEVRIDLQDDAPIFRKPYGYSEAERGLIKNRTMELLDAGLVELSNGEYASATVIVERSIILSFVLTFFIS